MSDSEIRDNGPFYHADQVMQQFANWSRGMPDAGLNSTEAAHMLLREALLLAGVQPSKLELDYAFAHGLDPALTQIVAGWLIRARLGQGGLRALQDAGYEPKPIESSDTSGQSSTPPTA
jgi:hypothetical protein